MNKGDNMSKAKVEKKIEPKDAFLEIKDRVDALKIEVDYHLDEILKVKDFKAQNTMVYETKDGTMTRCDVGEESIMQYALSLGLKSIEGVEVTENNLNELIEEHCGGVTGMVVLYYRMIGLALKKK